MLLATCEEVAKYVVGNGQVAMEGALEIAKVRDEGTRFFCRPTGKVSSEGRRFCFLHLATTTFIDWLPMDSASGCGLQHSATKAGIVNWGIAALRNCNIVVK